MGLILNGKDLGLILNGKEITSGGLLATGQSTVYAGGDDADILAGISKPTAVYGIKVSGTTTAVYVPTLARNDIAFVNATSKITAAAGLDVVKTGDVIRIRGSAGNETEFTVATGNVATEIVTTVAPTNEASGAYITIAKQALQSNDTVDDLNTNLTWLRYGSYSPAKLGAASGGLLLWTATAVSIHGANNDLKVTTGGKGLATYTIIGGAGEVLRYWPGYNYSFTVFAAANAKYQGYRCISVTVNGADLDILMNTGNQTVATEAGPINGVINLNCNDIFSFANACRAAGVGGYNDWRVANKNEVISLAGASGGTGAPNSTAFPGFSGVWVSTTRPDSTTQALVFVPGQGTLEVGGAKASTSVAVSLVRGGV